MTNKQQLLYLSRIWQKIALFHPQINNQKMADKMLLTALSAFGEMTIDKALVSLLNTVFFNPLQDDLSFIQYRNPVLESVNHSENNHLYLHYKQQCFGFELTNLIQVKSDCLQQLKKIEKTTPLILDCRAITITYQTELIAILAIFAQKSRYEIPLEYGVHQGWKETREPYIYQKYWQTETKLVYFGDYNQYKNKLIILINNQQILFLADYLQALQTEPYIEIVWEQQGLFNIPESQAFNFGAIESHLNYNKKAFKADYCCHQVNLSELKKAQFSQNTLTKIQSPFTLFTITEKPYLAGFIKLYLWVELFYPNLNKNLWQAAWAEFLIKIEKITDLKQYQTLLLNLLEPLQDKHARIIFNELEPTLEKEFIPEKPRLLFSPAMAYIKIYQEIAYMTPFKIPDRETLAEAFSLIKKSKALILDLRGYPCCHFKHELIQFLSQEQILSPRYEIPLISAYQSDLTQQFKVLQYTVPADKDRVIYNKPIVALIDQTLYSAAEDLCMYLKQIDHITFIGMKTAGCQGNICFVDLPFNGYAGFSGMTVRDLDGRIYHEIKVDIELKSDEKALEKALDYLNYVICK